MGDDTPTIDNEIECYVIKNGASLHPFDDVMRDIDRLTSELAEAGTADPIALPDPRPVRGSVSAWEYLERLRARAAGCDW